MCIGVPMRVVSADAGTALCEGRGERTRVDTRLVGDLPAGSWILAYRGAAIRTLSPEEAAQTLAALDALDAVLAGATGADVDAYFADLVGREPQLPDHLKTSSG
jgi:hydrogenase expression/formation protein HypC